jgi:hypothetical protein
MNRKKFFALFSTGIVGLAFIKANPLRLFTGKSEKGKHVEVKINPDAIKREKPGKKNG